MADYTFNMRQALKDELKILFEDLYGNKEEKEEHKEDCYQESYIYRPGDVLVDVPSGVRYLVLKPYRTRTAQTTAHSYENMYICLDFPNKINQYVETQKLMRLRDHTESFFVKFAKRVDHIDISYLMYGVPLNVEKKERTWEVTEEDLPEIIESLEEVGIEVEDESNAEIDRLKTENEDLKRRLEEMAKLKGAWKQGWYDCLDSFNHYLGN